MAATGFTPIILYHSTTGSAVPSNANLSPGELALNIADMKLYCENGSGVVTLLADAAAQGTVTSVDVSGGTTGLTTSGGPVTGSGTITIAGTLAVANGGTGITSFGSGVATWLGTPSSTNLRAAVTDETGTGSLVFAGSPTFTGTVTTAAISMADNLLTRPVLKDYAIEGSAIGNTGATRTLDLNDANFFSATLDQACTFTFSDPPASGDFGCFVLELTNGGAFAITWPAAVDWPDGTAPTLTASGVDQLVFTTRNAGTTWFGFVAGLDIK